LQTDGQDLPGLKTLGMMFNTKIRGWNEKDGIGSADIEVVWASFCLCW
jgi:hypothetical protein